MLILFTALLPLLLLQFRNCLFLGQSIVALCIHPSLYCTLFKCYHRDSCCYRDDDACIIIYHYILGAHFYQIKRGCSYTTTCHCLRKFTHPAGKGAATKLVLNIRTIVIYNHRPPTLPHITVNFLYIYSPLFYLILLAPFLCSSRRSERRWGWNCHLISATLSSLWFWCRRLWWWMLSSPVQKNSMVKINKILRFGNILRIIENFDTKKSQKIRRCYDKNAPKMLPL